MSDVCRSCGQTIQWVRMESGKSMPIDPLPPTDGGTIWLAKPMDPRDPPDAHVLRKGQTSNLPLYRSHFMTCPNAQRHRK